jgi:hypothetical protein
MTTLCKVVSQPCSLQLHIILFLFRRRAVVSLVEQGKMFDWWDTGFPEKV